MARPPKNTSPDRFTSTELAIAAAAPQRAMESLARADLLPPSAGEGGRGGVKLWTSRGVAHIALVGALRLTGVELLLAARLVNTVAEELESAYGQISANLERYLEKDLNPSHTHFPWSSALNADGDIRDEFWLHHKLVTGTAAYKPGLALDGDWIIEIADREFVFIGNRREKHMIQTLLISGSDADYARSLARIVGWERGSDATVLDFMAEVDRNYRDPDFESRAADLERKYMAARRNATGLLTINASLAIRNAFDAIHRHRRGNTAGPS